MMGQKKNQISKCENERADFGVHDRTILDEITTA